MKLISLNLWGGKLYEPLIKFIKKQSADTDIFCFQEVFDIDLDPPPVLESGGRADLYGRISATLPGFRGYFALTKEGADFQETIHFPLRIGLAMFVRHGIRVRDTGSMFVVADGAEGASATYPHAVPRNLQYITIISSHYRPLTIVNFHGLLDDGQKRDTVLRLDQFRGVKRFLDNVHHAKMLCGDFNVYPDTQSIRMFEEDGLRNLIKEFDVETTRNDNYKDMEKFKDYISDYAFVSPDIKVKNFEVLPDEVSDHLALELEFEYGK